MRTCGVLFLFASAAAFTLSPALTVTPLQAASSGKLSMSGAREVSIEVAPSAQNLGPTVLVAGATGRVGALVCQEGEFSLFSCVKLTAKSLMADNEY